MTEGQSHLHATKRNHITGKRGERADLEEEEIGSWNNDR